MLPNHPPPLSTARLALEPLGPQHAAALFVSLADREIYRYVPIHASATVEVLRERYARTSRGPLAPDERWWNWVIVTCDGSRRALGTVELSLRDGGRRASLAYAIARDAWGCGYATEACLAAFAHLRATARPCSIEAHVDTRNARSIALLERLGLRRKESISNADYFKGASSDEYRYELALHEDDDVETAGR
ncbi:MAG: GNAT family protein [Vulcanimicrobiaceae bacterium]